MRPNVSALALVLALSACEEAAPPGGRLLTPGELSRARSVPSHGDATIVYRDREYVGAVLVEVNSTAGTVLLRPVGVTTEPPLVGINGEFPLPAATARTLSSTGWDFTLQLHDDLVYADPQDGHLAGNAFEEGFWPTSLRMRAEPNGLFVATIELAHADGRRELVELYGRLTAGCAVFEALRRAALSRSWRTRRASRSATTSCASSERRRGCSARSRRRGLFAARRASRTAATTGVGRDCIRVTHACPKDDGRRRTKSPRPSSGGGS